MKLVDWIEKIVIIGLLVMIGATVLATTVDLGAMLIEDLWTPPRFLLLDTEISELFGFFLMIMVGLELLETIKSYQAEHRIHVEVVILVALVAVSRKIIILDYKKVEPLQLIGIASIVLSLAVGFFLIRRVSARPELPQEKG